MSLTGTVLKDPALQSNVLGHIQNLYSYTFILLSTSSSEIEEDQEVSLYTAAFDDAVHMDLKRDNGIRDGDSTQSIDRRPLFEKYQFLTPGPSKNLTVIVSACADVPNRSLHGIISRFGALINPRRWAASNLKPGSFLCSVCK